MKNKEKLFIVLSGILLIAVIVLVIVLKSGILVKAEYSSKYTQTFGEFTAETASKLLKDKTENTCYSPVSLFAALSLTAEVTEDKTQEEILKSLGVETIEELEKVYSQMLEDIHVDSAKSKITLANSMWIDKKYIVNANNEIVEKCREKLNCEIFETESIDAEEVNDWVAEKTNHLIKQILSNDNNYKLSLINTVYFKSAWMTDFSASKDREFKLEDGKNVKMDFIRSKADDMSYRYEADYTMVSVPMQYGEMVFVLPKEGIKLKKLFKEKKLNQILSVATGDDLEKGKVIIEFPEFECGDSFDAEVEMVLQNMGIKRLFTEGQWSICEENIDDFVKVVQKTRIKVDYKGIEAAAASGTSIIIADKPEYKEELEIILDRPFMYILMKDGVPLFIGTVYNPAE